MASVILGVAGGIAAYKACELLRLFTEGGHDVRVVPTRAALNFVGEATWSALSGSPVATDVWADAHEVPHVKLGRHADLVVVAPATADLLARAATGLADDLLTNVLLTARCPIVFAPAMHTEMWEHPAVQANVATLRSRGAHVLDPAVGRLTGADSGPGRLPDPALIHSRCLEVLGAASASARVMGDLAGRTVVISAGGTREPVDPVRYLGNRSSGRQGYALASTALARGARVRLIAANVELPTPAGAELVRVETTAELREAVLAAAGDADVVVMAAAVADFRPAAPAASKIKKSDAEPAPIELEQTADILAELSADRRRPGQIVVGFAAETDDVLANGRAKLARKGCDLLVVNDVSGGQGFGRNDNAAVLLGRDGRETRIPLGPKAVLADRVWDAIVERFADAG